MSKIRSVLFVLLALMSMAAFGMTAGRGSPEFTRVAKSGAKPEVDLLLLGGGLVSLGLFARRG